MSAKTSIEWTDATWSPIRYRVRADAMQIAQKKIYLSLIPIAQAMTGSVGQFCERISPGCAHCYSETMQSRRLPHNGTGLPFDRRSRDLVEPFIDEEVLREPLKWRKPKRIFVENQSDLFGEWVPDEMIDRVFAVMSRSPEHTFQVLTKRSGRMRKYLTRPGVEVDLGWYSWPLQNVWLGVSVEDQQRAEDRIPDLLDTPAAMRFLSCEPLLDPVDLARWLRVTTDSFGIPVPVGVERRLDWVIVGGESGRGARPMRPDWVRSIRDQCLAAGVPFFFKQWGAWVQFGDGSGVGMKNALVKDRWRPSHRLLDGREWSEFPEPRS